MFQKFKVNKLILNKINREFLKISHVILNKKFKNLDELLSKLNSKEERLLFDAFNLSLTIYELINPIKKKIEKKINKKLLLWTYPQVRIDLIKNKKFSAPLHKDQWILSKNTKGYVVWLPVNDNGGSLKLVSEKIKKFKIIKNKYWGIEIQDNDVKQETQNISYGQAVIFDHKKIHASDLNNQRISVQYRFKELNKLFADRGINQVIDNKIKEYWKKKLNAK